MTPGVLTGLSRALALTGAVLFLIGLVQGLVVDQFANPRMALSAHLDAVQSGMAVMIAALFWPSAFSESGFEKLARWTLIAGMVGIWAGITLAAMTGASEAFPFAGEGYSASALAEVTVTILMVASSLAALTGWGAFCWGLFRGPARGRS